VPAINEAFIPEMFDRVNERLRAIEAQLALLSEKAGVPYEAPGSDVPEDVVELAKEGKTLEAIKRYRELTGAGGDEAREVVAGI
jgi:ribosomal protein L7/L12